MNPTPDRRQILGAASVSLTALTTGQGGSVIIPVDPSRAALADAGSRLETLARQWETTPPASLADQLRALERHTRSMGRWRTVPDLRRDWQHLHARVLVTLAAALGDGGSPALAVTCARHAGTLAGQVGDAVSVANAGILRAELAAYTFGRPARGLALAAAALAAAPRSHTAVLALTAEANIRAGRAERLEDIAAVLRHAEAVQATLPAGPVGFSLDGLHPGYLPAFGGAALVRGGDITRGRAWLAAAAELFDPAHASGAMSAVRLYQAAAALRSRDLDEAHVLATQALAVSAGRPATWLSDGVLLLADYAGRAGEDWSDLAAQAHERPPA